MKILKKLTVTVLSTALFAVAIVGLAADEKKTTKPKPYPLKTCVVSGEKLGDHGKPYVFTHEGQEIKMCCEDCLKDFKKNTATYMKKIEDAQKKEKK